MDIGDGYYVWRPWSGNVGIGSCIAGELCQYVLNQYDYDKVGPIAGYSTTPKFVFTKNIGRKPYKRFQGDEDVDPTKEFFFIIYKEKNKVIGPLSGTQFYSRPEVSNLSPLDWKTPKNPNFWLPLLGNLMFLAFIIVFFPIHFYYVTIPSLVLAFILFRRISRKKSGTGS